LVVSALLLCALLTNAQLASPDRAAGLAFQQLNDHIRDQTIKRADAQRQLNALLPRLDAYYKAAGGQAYRLTDWIFPLRGYTPAIVGGVRGNGYQPKGYDYFKGNRHAGHPAHDLFIYDKNQDGFDDHTRQPVEVRALTGGVVVAVSTSWTPGSVLRGGNYVWVYAPYARSLFYYAHNATVRVSVGDIVRPGDVLATVGRTGFNAYQKRSPTHLHLMQLTLSAQHTPVPTDCYQALLKARTHP
jgi:peptidoglycan LD-endopeptidase LytH